MELEPLENEIWKDVKGYEGYMISNYGRVWSCKRNIFLKYRVNEKGYLSVVFYLGSVNDRYDRRIHQLVYENFVGEIPDGYEIDHIDGDKTNNTLSNLRLVTHKENMNNPITKTALSKAQKGKKWSESRREKMKGINQKKVCQYTKDGVLIKVWDSPVVVERSLGYHKGNICLCAKGIRPTASGYIWRYIA